jgi:beta-hydroxyacyl-ACP dehydratase FabZ
MEASERTTSADVAEIDTLRIMELIPHRPPFLMIDKVVDVVAGERAIGVKNVTINDGFFQGHFPARPVMPGVLIIEAMAQVAGVLVLKSIPDRKNKLVLLATIEQAKFRGKVRPGDQLRVEMKVTKRKANIAKMHGKATVDGVVVAEAELMCVLQEREPSVVAPASEEPVPVA